MFLLVFFLLGSFNADINQYKGASGVILLDSTVVKIQKDKKIEKERFLRIKILREKGRDDFGDIKERYDKETQKFKVVTARTISPSGKIVKVEKDAISDVSAPEVGVATQYTNVLMKVVSFPALEPNAIIEYHYRVKSKKKSEHPFSGMVLFQGTSPIQQKTFTIIFPEEMETNFSDRYTGSITKKENRKNGFVMYTYCIRNVGRIQKEPSMPEISEIAPRLEYTFYKSYNEFGKWYGENFYGAVGVGKDIKKKVDEIGGKTREERIKNIVLFVKQRVRSVNLYFGDAGYKPHKASKVLKNMYGDPQDKAVLLVSLLKAIGVRSYPVLVTGEKRRYFSPIGLPSVLLDNNATLPVPSRFSGILVAVENGKTLKYYAPMERNGRLGWLPYMYQGKKSLIVKKDSTKLVILPILSVTENISKIFFNGEIDDNGNLKGEFQLNASGSVDYVLRNQLWGKNKKEYDIFFKGIVNGVMSGSRLISYNFSDPDDITKDMSIKISFESPGYVTKQGNFFSVNIPILHIYGMNPPNLSVLKERKYDLILNSRGSYCYSLSVKIPQNFKVYYTPPQDSLENEEGEFSFKTKKENDTLKFFAKFINKEKRIPKDKYKEYKDLLERYYKGNMWKMMFTE